MLEIVLVKHFENKKRKPRMYRFHLLALADRFAIVKTPVYQMCPNMKQLGIFCFFIIARMRQTLRHLRHFCKHRTPLSNQADSFQCLFVYVAHVLCA